MLQRTEEMEIQVLTFNRFLNNRLLGTATLNLQRLLDENHIQLASSLLDINGRPLKVSNIGDRGTRDARGERASPIIWRKGSTIPISYFRYYYLPAIHKPTKNVIKKGFTCGFLGEKMNSEHSTRVCVPLNGHLRAVG